MGDLSSGSKPVVLVTGFGPFGTHAVNASWVSVKILQEIGLGDDVELVVREIPVDYNVVRKEIPTLWHDLKPKLVVHVGVSGVAKELTLEQQAHNNGYDKKDVRGECPSDRTCILGADECKRSGLDMTAVCSALNNSSENDVTAVVSMDPGRYLCDFIYYTSLNQNAGCSAFVHVPPLDKPYSAAQLGRALRAAVRAMLAQLL